MKSTIGGGDVRVGTSGWVYPPWRGVFYPAGLAQRQELTYLAGLLTSTEINSSFYALQRPATYQRWFADTPDDFVFTIKGPRFVTHLKQLRDPELTLPNFFASGVLALGGKLGPVLWQLPPRLAFDPSRLTSFFDALPRTTSAAALLAEQHDERLDDRAWTSTDADRPIRHALEVRHPSYVDPAFVELLRGHDIALVVADTAGAWPRLEDVTADFVYLRLHGDEELYASGYTDAALDEWAARIERWRAGKNVLGEHTVARALPERPAGRDVFAYFDNDVKVKAPRDAQALADRLGLRPQGAKKTDLPGVCGT